MKNIKGFIFGIFVVCLLFLGCEVKALSDTTDYISVSDSTNISVGSIVLSNITFTNTDSYFGVKGNVNNSSSDNVDYILSVTYFDIYYNYISSTSSTVTSSHGNSSFSLVLSLSKLGDHSLDDIKYYQIKLVIKDDEENATTSEDSSIEISTSDGVDYSNLSYVIDEYDVKIIVNENNTFDITETITANFYTAKHGIYRNIPTTNNLTRTDGTTSSNLAQISNVSVSDTYTTYYEDGDYVIKIGDSNKTLTGSKTYTISYTYNIGEDPLDDIDEFYYNIIGDEWDTVIKDITFTIVMPKSFDTSKIGFSHGINGSVDSSNVNYEVDENTITGSFSALNKYEALTIRIELDEGYFVGASLNVNSYIDLMVIVPFVLFIISLFIWFKVGRDDKYVSSVEFYPPQGFNSLDVAFLYKGEASNKDVISLLIYLAEKGYIKITETVKKGLFGNTNGFKITKLKEYDGNNNNEKMFLDGLKKKKTIYLFGNKNNNNVEENPDEIDEHDLYDSFYRTIDEILKNTNSKENKNMIYYKKNNKYSVLLGFMITISLLLLFVIPGLNYGVTGDNDIMMLIFSFITAVLIIFSIRFKSMIEIIWCFGWLIALVVFIAFSSLGMIFYYQPIYLISFIIGLVCIVGIRLCQIFMPKRTPYGNNMLGKIEGFKEFLKTAEKDRLEMLVSENPNYFYDILPYAYVLGVSDKWVKQFEVIGFKDPDWCEINDGFSYASFNNFMMSTMSRVSSTMTSSPSSSSDGSSSGGGSSGGGSGGGGGGSW